MKIKKLECWNQKLSLNEPYAIAYETINYSYNVFLRAITDNGFIGWGCAAPDKGVTNETHETVQTAFTNSIEPILKGSNPFHYAAIHEELKKELATQPSAQAMADMLLYDLIAQKAGVPLYMLLGGFREFIPTSITIGILPLDETIDKAKHYVKKGFSILKIKGGKDLEIDIDRVHKIREIFGKTIEIRFDANQGYTAEEAIQFISRTSQDGIELLEQPISKNEEHLLGKVSQNISVPVMADESIMNLKDVFRLTRNDLTDMINIKLMKVGGITEALHINSVARAAGVEVMVGCMDESSLSISAGLHFALARPNIVYADLDSFFEISDDPFKGLFILHNGTLYPRNRNGIGVISKSVK
ncbi:MAG: dipeptide epimerase [Chitinispirillia bacterium]|jgi:L-alanine-DL-glutamate epimerase-like enolase superfamily enzyme